MSILTKIIVVLVSIAAVVVSTLFVADQANRQTFRKRWQDAEESNKILAQNATAQRENLKTILADHAGEIAKRETETGAAKAETNNLRTQLAKTQGDLIDARAQFAGVSGQLATLAAANKQMSDLAGLQRAELKDRRDRELKLQTENITLTDQLRESRTQGDSLVRQIRLLTEQLAETRESIEKLQAGAGRPGVAAVPGTAETVQPATLDKAVRGLVTKVEKIGEDTFVAINLGENDKVRKGMKFMVHEGANFLASGVVTTVDLNASAVRLTLIRGTVKVNHETTSVDY